MSPDHCVLLIVTANDGGHRMDVSSFFARAFLPFGASVHHIITNMLSNAHGNQNIWHSSTAAICSTNAALA
eukprot:scaffold302774_cov20-Prasinocladus_malaysianus.AAC.1